MPHRRFDFRHNLNKISNARVGQDRASTHRLHLKPAMVCDAARRSRHGTACARQTGLLAIMAAIACLSARCTLALPRAPRDAMHRRGLLPAVNQGARLGLLEHGVAGRGVVVRLRGGVAESEPETESEDDRPPAPKLSAPSKPPPAAAKPTPAPAVKAPAAQAASPATTVEEAAAGTEGGEEEEAAAAMAAMSISGEAAAGEEGGLGEDDVNATGANATRPPLTPDMIQKLNERLWEAAAEGNEPAIQKVTYCLALPHSG